MTAINRGLRSKRKRKELDSRITHTHTTHYSNNDDKFENLESLTVDDLVDVMRLLKRQKRQIEAIRRLHRNCGNRSIKRFISLKRRGNIKTANLPSHFLKKFKVECPICMTSSRKRKKLPGPSTVKEERAQLKKWEVVYVDTSGKFQVKSARDYFYYSVFVDRKDGEKIAIGHTKK